VAVNKGAISSSSSDFFLARFDQLDKDCDRS